MRATVVRDPRFQEHDPGPWHPECPERLRAIDEALAEGPVRLEALTPRAATREELLRVHTAAYVDGLDRLRGESLALDPDTSTSPGSVDAAYLAAGSSVELCARVARREVPPGIALVRPPGHHALPDRAMGFCLFNNVAVAARALIAEGLAERVAIYDWDVHHGNGTQEIFFDDPQVLYLSTHQWPFYPGTGRASETGRGPGEGATVNVPLPEGTGDEVMLEVTDNYLLPKVYDFAPDIILISAGFDPFERDPVGGFRMTVDGFKRLGARWRAMAERIAHGKIAAVLEGGYELRGLGACVAGLIDVWSSP